ncbi:MAG: DNA gyrase inhibitor YacG [Alphaproteobacteria bacterium]
MHHPKCPVCGKQIEQKLLSFCSAQCQKIDLGKWLSESYVISLQSDDENYLPESA